MNPDHVRRACISERPRLDSHGHERVRQRYAHDRECVSLRLHLDLGEGWGALRSQPPHQLPPSLDGEPSDLPHEVGRPNLVVVERSAPIVGTRDDRPESRLNLHVVRRGLAVCLEQGEANGAERTILQDVGEGGESR